MSLPAEIVVTNATSLDSFTFILWFLVYMGAVFNGGYAAAADAGITYGCGRLAQSDVEVQEAKRAGRLKYVNKSGRYAAVHGPAGWAPVWVFVLFWFLTGFLSLYAAWRIFRLYDMNNVYWIAIMSLNVIQIVVWWLHAPVFFGLESIAGGLVITLLSLLLSLALTGLYYTYAALGFSTYTAAGCFTAVPLWLIYLLYLASATCDINGPSFSSAVARKGGVEVEEEWYDDDSKEVAIRPPSIVVSVKNGRF